MKDITNYQNEQEIGYKLVEKFLELAKEYKKGLYYPCLLL